MSLADADTFLRDLARRVSALAPGERRALAVAIAERHVAVLGEDEGGTRTMIATARERAVARSELAVWAREREQTRAMIDPDREGANDKLRALAVIQLALAACAEGAVPEAAPAVARAALAARALRWPAETEREQEAERSGLAKRWAWDAVQDEARWLSAWLDRHGT